MLLLESSSSLRRRLGSIFLGRLLLLIVFHEDELKKVLCPELVTLWQLWLLVAAP